MHSFLSAFLRILTAERAHICALIGIALGSMEEPQPRLYSLPRVVSGQWLAHVNIQIQPLASIWDNCEGISAPNFQYDKLLPHCSFSLCVTLASFPPYRCIPREYSPIYLLHAILHLKICFQGTQMKTIYKAPHTVLVHRRDPISVRLSLPFIYFLLETTALICNRINMYPVVII